jgi:hypothetical protein
MRTQRVFVPKSFNKTSELIGDSDGNKTNVEFRDTLGLGNKKVAGYNLRLRYETSPTGHTAVDYQAVFQDGKKSYWVAIREGTADRYTKHRCYYSYFFIEIPLPGAWGEAQVDAMRECIMQLLVESYSRNYGFFANNCSDIARFILTRLLPGFHSAGSGFPRELALDVLRYSFQRLPQNRFFYQAIPFPASLEDTFGSPQCAARALPLVSFPLSNRPSSAQPEDWKLFLVHKTLLLIALIEFAQTGKDSVMADFFNPYISFSTSKKDETERDELTGKVMTVGRLYSPKIPAGQGDDAVLVRMHKALFDLGEAVQNGSANLNDVEAQLQGISVTLLDRFQDNSGPGSTRPQFAESASSQILKAIFDILRELSLMWVEWEQMELREEDKIPFHVFRQ